MARFWNRWIGRLAPSRRKQRNKRASLRRRPQPENLETRQLLASNVFQNLPAPDSVNDTSIVASIDSRANINEVNRQIASGQVRGGNGDNSQPDRDRLSQNSNDRTNNRGDRPDDSTTPEAPTTDVPTDEDPVVSETEADPVLLWSDVFGEVLGDSTENQNPGYASRSAAILNLAIFDAVALASGNADGTYYEYDASLTDLDTEVSAELAATAAAYTALSELYPDQQAQLDAALEASLEALDYSGNQAASLTLGEEVANQILALRVEDGSDVVGEYTYSDEPGAFQPDPLNPDIPAWGPEWGEVDTFAISSTDDVVPESPPDLTSEAYAESYNEVLALGSVDSTERTAEQTEIGLFWAYDTEGMGTPIALYMDVLESVATQQGNSFEENVALFAQASVAMADAAIVAWETKFTEEFWRPITAINQGDSDGNPLTEGDEDWTALGAPDGDADITGFTPQFPTYISGHATFGGALFGTLQNFYGTDDISFELTSEELEQLLENPELQEAYGLDLDDATRSFDSFSEAMAENGRSRVYLGIHFDFDDLVGQEVGQAVAASVAQTFASLTDADDTSDASYEISGTVVATTQSTQRGDSSRNNGNNRNVSLLSQNQRGDDTEGVAGVTVELLDSSGNVIDQTTTNARGNYSFDVSDAGSYQVQIAASARWTVVGTDIQDVLLSESQDQSSGIDFRIRLA